MNRKSYVHQISKISPIERVRSRAVASERRCIGVDRQCRESEGKVKIEGYMSISDEEAHQQRRISSSNSDEGPRGWSKGTSSEEETLKVRTALSNQV